MSIYGGNKNWSNLNDVVPRAPTLHAPATTPPATPLVTADWSSARKAAPADYLLPLSEKWFDALPPDRAPCALATVYPRIVNLIAAQWNDHRGCPLLFEDLLGDRRGGRAGFPAPVRRDLLRLQEYWYSGALKLR